MLNRREFVRAAVGAAAGLSVSALAKAAVAKKPNFLFVLVDDLGWADLRCYGSTFYDTPNLDRLAASGMKFVDAYAACPVCSPTRAAIMTGRHPVRVDITDWIKGNNPRNPKLLAPQDRDELALEEVTIAEVLRDNGYQTFFAGKWHLGEDEKYWPLAQGFDINKGGFRRGSPPGGYYSPYKNPVLEDGPKGEYLPDRLTNETISFLMSRDKSKPFLAYLAFYTVHTPIQTAPRHLDKYKKRLADMPQEDMINLVVEHKGKTKLWQDRPDYATMVQAMDDNIGRLMDTLKNLGLDDNTVVIFTSDNGGLATLRDVGPTSNAPLRSGKGWCYEGGIRVPLIIRAPGLTNAGTVSKEPVVSMDYFPTMLDMAGIAQKPDIHKDGYSLVPVIKKGAKLNRDAICWHYPHYHGSTWTPGAAIRARDWKLIEFYEEDKIELYNLADDIGEKNDLSKKMPEKAKQMHEILKKWQKETGAKMPKPNPDYKPKP
ncbi:MAG: sulfatase [Phycisphaerae bacterium]|nr:sulfatase [Phycisphaerae bacterium]